MPNKKSNKYKRGRRRTPQSSIVPANQLVYSGPISVPSTREAEDIIQVILTYEEAVTTNVAGAILNVYTSDPLLANGSAACYALSTYQALYRQYRTLGFEIQYFPNAVNAVSVVGFGYSPVTTVVDREVSTPLSSYGGAAIYPSVQYHMINGLWTVAAKMSSTQDSEFLQVGTVNPFAYYIKLFGQDFIAGDVYGRILYRILVQFRGRV